MEILEDTICSGWILEMCHREMTRIYISQVLVM